MKQLALALLLLAAAPAAAGATAPAAAAPTGSAATEAAPAIPPAERAERLRLADDLMAESGAKEVLDQMLPSIVGALMPALSTGNTGREAEIKAILTEEFSAALKIASPAILEKSRDLYVEHFTADELKQILAFNRTPVGRKANKALPEIQIKMMAYGQEAGQAAAAVALPRILDRLKAADLAVPNRS